MTVGAFFLAVALGPHPTLDTNGRRTAHKAPLDQALAAAERRFTDITPGTEKTILWATKPGARSDWSLVYLHGFSATRRETTPLTETVSRELGANVFLTRLAGHGRGPDALSAVDGSDWLADTHEAFGIGQQLGRRVAMIGVSTGATLATWLAAEPLAEQPDALVLISPNFALADSNAKLLTWPWGLKAAELLLGRERSFDTANKDHATYWTTRYDMRAAGELMALVSLVQQVDFESLDVPVLYIRSDRDRVIDMAVADQVFERLPNPNNQLHIVLDTQDPYGHVIAGDILSPGSTAELTSIISNWLSKLPTGG